MIAEVDAGLNRNDEMVFGAGNLIIILYETILIDLRTMRISTF